MNHLSPAIFPAHDFEQRAFSPTASHQYAGNLAVWAMLAATAAVQVQDPLQRTIDCAASPGGSAALHVDTRRQQRYWLGNAVTEHFGRTTWRDKVVIATRPPDGLRIISGTIGIPYSYPELAQTGEPWVVMNNRATDAYVWTDTSATSRAQGGMAGLLKVTYTCGG